MLKKSLSQHLIKDSNILNKMIRTAGISEDDIVVEIGPGQGDFTRCLSERVRFVYGVELDQDFKPYLEPLERERGNIRFIFGDFLRTPLSDFQDSGKIVVVGNIPYKITGPILFKIIAERDVVKSCHLTMQREIAERIVSPPFRKTYGSLSVVCQLYSHVKMEFIIRPGVFVPPPKVDSAFVSLIFKDGGIGRDDGLIRFIRECFQNKRKFLSYSLGRLYGADAVGSLYESMGLSRTTRAEELAPDRFVEIYRFLVTHSPRSS